MLNIELNESKLLFSILSSVLFGAGGEPDFSSCDISALYEESKKQSISSIIFKRLPSALAAEQPQLYGDWLNRTMFLISRNSQIVHAHAKLGELLSSAGIPYCILKGVVSAAFYPVPADRDMGDVDFLVHPDNVKAACELLEKDGYVKVEDADEHDFHIGYKKGRISYELHYSFTESDDEAFNERFTSELLENTAPLELSGAGSVCAVTDEYHCIIMLLHMKRHMTSSGMGLRHLCDWAVFVNNFSSEDFVSRFKPLIDENGLWRFAQVLSQSCEKFLGIAHKEWFGEVEDELCANLTEYIFSTGNFGSKGVNFSDLFIKNTGDMSSDASRQVMTSIKKIVISHWPSAEKNPLVMAVGMVFFPMRYLFRSLIGKRKKVNIAKVIKSGNTANETVKQLDLYKDEKE